MIVVAVAVVMWESPQGFPRGVGRVESRFMAFHAPFPCGISMACFLVQFVRLDLFIAPLNLKPVPTWRNALKSRIQLLTVRGVNYKLPVYLTFDLLVTSAVLG